MATYANSLPEQNAASSEKAQLPWTAIAWFGALLIACYAPVLFGLVRQWATDEDVGHGFFVPFVAGYIIWKRRGQLTTKNPVPNYWGLDGVFLNRFAPFFRRIRTGRIDFSQQFVHHPDRAIDHRLADINQRGHVRNFFAHQAKIADRLAKRLALLGIPDGALDR